MQLDRNPPEPLASGAVAADRGVSQPTALIAEGHAGRSLPRHTGMTRPADLLRLIRPGQWVKNAFVFAGVIFG
jgi:hypothetical protein